MAGEHEWQDPFSMGVKASNADTLALREIRKLLPEGINTWHESMDIDKQLSGPRMQWQRLNVLTSRVDQQIIKSNWAFRGKQRLNG